MENYIDLILIIPLLWGIVRGLFKGFIMSIGSIIGLLLAFYLSNTYAPVCSNYLATWFTLSNQLSYVLAYLMIFVVVIVLIFSISLLLEKSIKLVSLGWLNKLIGAIVGFLKYAFICSLLINLVEIVDEKVDIIKQETKETSYLYQPLKKIVPSVMPTITYYSKNKNNG